MPDEPEVLIFEFNFDGEVITQEAPPYPQEADAEPELKVESGESRMIQWLNENADNIASDVEREVSRVLRPFALGPVTVQAEVRFHASPLIIEGAVIAVVGALGTVAAQAVSQALGQNLARLLEIPTNRLLRRWMNRSNEAVQAQSRFEPFGINVSSTRTQQQATFWPGPQEPPPVPATSQREPAAPGITWLSWITAALALLNALLLIITLVLLLTTMVAPTQAP